MTVLICTPLAKCAAHVSGEIPASLKCPGLCDRKKCLRPNADWDCEVDENAFCPLHTIEALWGKLDFADQNAFLATLRSWGALS
jgi:hypothetical protein